MKVDALISAFRTQINDAVAPYLWSDEEVYGYIDAAQKMFCRLAVGISDSTSELTVVWCNAGDEFVTYDSRILRIRMARRGSDYYDLTVRNFEDYMAGQTGVTDYGSVVRPKLTSETGPVHTIITNMEQNKLRLVYIPEVDDSVLLTVYRLPLLTISIDEGNELEIDEQHHWYLLYWMKHLAYMKEDAETFDKTRAVENETKFRTYCDEVSREVARREHKVRVVAYGGI